MLPNQNRKVLHPFQRGENIYAMLQALSTQIFNVILSPVSLV